MKKPDEKYMQVAIKEARKNFKSLSGGPFGAAIVKGGKTIAVACNRVLKNDPTAHAEVQVIRKAAKKLRTYDLSGCVIYSTTEPCPMCFGAIHWARISTIIYGTTINDAKTIGFNELCLSNARLKALGKSKVKIIPRFMRKECKKLFSDWGKLNKRIIY